MFNTDSFGNTYFPAGVSVGDYPIITSTPTYVLVAGLGGLISKVSVNQLVSNTAVVNSVFGRQGDIVALPGDYTSEMVKEVTNLYFTELRARSSISITTSGTTGPATYNSTTGVINIPQYQNDFSGVSSFNNRVGDVVLTALDVTNALTYTPLALETDPVWAAQKVLYYTKLETESYVTTQISNLVDSAPTTLNTLNELAAALGDDANFATTTATSLGNRLRIDIGTQGLTSTQQGYGRTNLGLGTAALSSTGDFATAAQGTKADTAYSWGNHSLAGYLTSLPSHNHDDRYYTETEVNTLLSGKQAAGNYFTDGDSVLNMANNDGLDYDDTNNVMRVKYDGTLYNIWSTKEFSSTSVSNWNTAYGWGNHVSAGYQSASTAITTSNIGSQSVSYATTAGSLSSMNISQFTNNSGYITGYTETDTLASVTGRGSNTTDYVVLNGGAEVWTNPATGVGFRLKRNTGSTTGDDVVGIYLSDGAMTTIMDNDNDGDSSTFEWQYKTSGINSTLLSFSNGSITFQGNTIWNSGNDGSGSGLDADLWDGSQFADYLNQAVRTTDSPTFAGLNLGNGNLNTVQNIYLDDAIYSEGDTNTYMQFHAADQWRVVTGGSERLEVNNSAVTVDGLLQFTLGSRATANADGRSVLIEGKANAANGEASGRIFFTEHNSTSASADLYGLSLYYEGDAAPALPSGFQPNTGNATWSLRRHDNSLNGDAILSGTRGSDAVSFSGTVSMPNIDTGQGVTEVHLMDQNIRTTDSPTFVGMNLSSTLDFGSSNAVIKLSRGGWITFYEDGNAQHAIGSRDSAGSEADDIRINSFGAVYINLDSNDNNTSGADFLIGRHGSSTSTISTLFTLSGETGEATFINVVNATAVNTGQGDNELYAMNQDVRTTDIVNFDRVITSRLGLFGTYSSTQVQGIWSIGSAYTIDTSLDTFGNQYGMAYAYSTNGGAPFSTTHQILFVNNGSIGASIGLTGNAQFNASVRSPIFYDSNDTGYYVDPNSESKVFKIWINNGGASSVGWSTGLNMGDGSNYWNLIQDVGIARQRNFGTGGYDWFSSGASQIMILNNSGDLTTSSSMRTPIFYDSDNTAYYADLSSTGTSINTSGTIVASTFNATSITNGGFQGIDGDSAASPSFTWTADLNSGMWRVSSDVVGISAGGNDEFRVYTSYALALGSMRSPIFYDSNDTAYYTNPASTSNLNALTVAGGRCIVTGDYFEPRANLGGISANRNPATSAGVFIGWNRSGGNSEANYISGTNGRVDWGRWTGTAYTLFMTLGTTGGLANLTGSYGTISSDIRLKENIEPASSKLNDILSLNVVNFSFKSDENKEKHIGFIAQEFQEIFPSLVTVQDNREYDDNGNVIYGYEDSLGLKVGMEFAILTKAIQEQQEIIESLKQEIELLKNN